VRARRNPHPGGVIDRSDGTRTGSIDRSIHVPINVPDRVFSSINQSGWFAPAHPGRERVSVERGHGHAARRRRHIAKRPYSRAHVVGSRRRDERRREVPTQRGSRASSCETRSTRIVGRECVRDRETHSPGFDSIARAQRNSFDCDCD